MSSCQRFAAAILALVICLSWVTPASADAFFFAPGSVQADGSGHFSFNAVLTAGAGCVGFAGYHFEGTTNVSDFLFVDTFCIDPQPVAEGGTVLLEVTGTLDDPSLGGEVFTEGAFCLGGGGSGSTLILAPTVAVEAETWSGLKACYR